MAVSFQMIEQSIRREAIWLFLAVLIIAAAVSIPSFRDPGNLANVARQASVLAVLAVGQTFVISAGMIDISIGMIAGLVSVLACALIDGNTPMTLPVVALMLVVGASIGAVNGVLLNWLRLHPLILTLGMLSVLHGVIFTFTDRSVGRASEPLAQLANGSFFGIPLILLLLAPLVVLAHVLYTRTAFGYHLLAVGGNADSARRAGINVARIRLAVFIISGVTAAIGGLILAGRLGTGYPLAGAGFELDAIVAVALGGTSLAGGRGSVIRSLAGVCLLAILSNVLNLMGVAAFVQMLIKGLVVIIAILLNQPPREQQ